MDRIFTCPLMIYRKLKFGYSFRRIHLGDGVYTLVDIDVFYRLSRHKWQFRSGRNRKLYAVRNVQTTNGLTKQLSLHREIADPPEGLIVDHLNGNSLDNRIANLRPATYSQNAQNVPKKKNTSSRFIGVCFHKSKKKYEAYITFERKRRNLGHYEIETDAAKAYDAAAIKYFGKFAKLNFPKEIERSPRRFNLRLANWLGAKVNFPDKLKPPLVKSD